MTPAETASAGSEALGRFAGQEFLRLLRGAPAAVAAGRTTRAAAEHRLQCWLAIACRAHAELPQLAPLLADHRRPMVYRAKTGWREEELAEDEARRRCADAIRPRSAWAPVLAAARDKALSATETDRSPQAQSRARALCALAEALGVPLQMPTPGETRRAA